MQTQPPVAASYGAPRDRGRAERATTPSDVAPVDLAEVVAQVEDYAIITLDPQGSIVSWNVGAERLKGYTADEVAGHHFSIFYTPEDRQAGLPAELLARARTNGHIDHAGWRVRKDGTRFWAEVSITAVRDESGSVTGYVKVTRDRTSHHELELALQRSEQRLRILVSQVSDYAIIGLDPQGNIVSWNAGAEKVKGYTADEVIDRHFSIFYTPDDRRAGLPAKLLGQAREHGHVQHAGWRVRKDGTRFWSDVSITALHDDDGRITGFAKVTRDRSDVKALEDAQDSFYAAFRHDFAAPVFALQLSLDAIRAQADESMLPLIDRADLNVERLRRMSQDLIDFAQLRAGRAPLHLEALDVVSATRNAITSMTAIAETERVRIVDAAVPPVQADSNALERILVNLVSNALKYSSDEVVLDFTPRGRVVEIKVVDHGRGIHPDDLDTIFDEFERGKLAENDGGTGLGLASVKALVLQQGGHVTIDSAVGTGTTVTVSLPAA